MMRQIGGLQSKNIMRYLSIMSFNIRTIELTSQDHQHLKQRLLAEHPKSAFLLELLSSSEEQLEYHLSSIRKECMSTIGNRLQTKSKQLFFLAFCHRINSWKPPKIEDEEKLIRALLIIQKVFSPGRLRQLEIVTYFVSRVATMKKGVNLLEETFIKNLISLEREQERKEIQNSIKEFLLSSYKKIASNKFTEPVSEEQEESKDKQLESNILKAKIIKLFYWILPHESLSCFDLKELDVWIKQNESLPLFSEIVQIKVPQSQEIVNKISEIAIIKSDVDSSEYKLCLPECINPSIISNELFQTIFKTSSLRKDILLMVSSSKEEKQIIFAHNIVELPPQAFCNLLPHEVLSDSKENIELRTKIFEDFIEKASLITSCVAEGWKFKAVDYNQGKISLASYEAAQKVKLIRICTWVWEIVLRLIEQIPTQGSSNKKTAYCQFFNISQMQADRIKENFTRILNISKELPPEMLNSVCWILLALQRIARYHYRTIFTNQQFMINLFEKIQKTMEAVPDEKLFKESITFLCEKQNQIKDFAQTGFQHPFNCPAVFQLLYKKDLKQEGSTLIEESLSFGIYGIKQETTQVLKSLIKGIRIEQFSQFASFLEQQSYHLASLISTEGGYQIAPIDNIRIKVFISIYLNKKIIFERPSILKDKMIKLTNSKAVFEKILTQDYNELSKKLDINIGEQIEETINSLNEKIQGEELLNWTVEDIQNPWYQLPSPLSSFIHLMGRLKFLFKVVASGACHQSAHIFTPIALCHSLNRFKKVINRKYIDYHAEQTVQSLERKISLEQNLNKICQMTIQKEVEHLMNQIIQTNKEILKYIGNFNDFDFFQSLKRSNFLLDEVLCDDQKWIDSDGIWTLEFLLVSHENHKNHRMGLLFLTQNWEKVFILAEKIYIKRQNLQNKTSDLLRCLSVRRTDQLLNFFIDEKKKNMNIVQSFEENTESYVLAAFQKLLESLFLVSRGSESVLINEMIIKGPKHSAFVQKNIFFLFLTHIKTNFNLKIIKFYNFLIKKMSANITALEGKSKRQESISNNGLNATIKLPLLSKQECDQTLSSLKLEFMKVLIEQPQQKQDTSVAKQIVQNLYKGIPDKTKYKKQTVSILKILVSRIQPIIEQKKRGSAYQQAFEWLNRFLQHAHQIKFDEIVSVSLANKFIITVQDLLKESSASKEELQVSFPLLEKLLPLTFQTDKRDKMLLHCRKIARIMQEISSRTHLSGVTTPIIESAVFKLIVSKDKELCQHAGRIIANITNYTKLVDFLCEDIQQHFGIQTKIQADIKTMFLKYSQPSLRENEEQMVETKIIHLISFMKDKYRDDHHILAEVLSQFVYKHAVRGINPEITRLVYLPKEEYHFSRFKKTKFIDFKIPTSLASFLKIKIQNLTTELAGNIILIKELKKIVYNSPFCLPYILFHPVISNNTRKTFLEWLVEMVWTVDNSELKGFLFFTCLDHSIIIKSQDRNVLFSDYVCFKIVRHSSTMPEINFTSLLGIMSLCQLYKFTRYCNISCFSGALSLHEQIQKILLSKAKPDGAEGVRMQIVCSVLISLLSQQLAFEKMPKEIIFNFKNKSSNCSLTDSCTYPFDGVLAPVDRTSEESRYQQQLLSVEEFDLLNLKLAETLSETYEELCTNAILNEDKDTKMDQGDIDEIVLNHLGETKTDFHVFKTFSEAQSRISKSFSNLGTSLYKWGIKQEKPSLENRTCSCFSQRHSVDPVDDEEITFFKMMRLGSMEHSRYAVHDFTLTGRNNHPDFLDGTVFPDIILGTLKQVPSKIKNIQFEQIQKQCEEEEKQRHEMQTLISSINHNNKLLKKPEIHVSNLKGFSKKALLEFLREKNTESEFDLKEATMDCQQFQEYCFHNLNRLERLQSGRRNKVRQMQEQMIQLHIRRTESDSLDYIIDIIDENYQLLSSISRERSQGSNVHKKSISLKWTEPKCCQIPLEIFPEMDDEVIYQILSLFYLSLPGLKYSNYVPLLQNKKIKGKVVATLLYMYRNPFNNQLFPKHMTNAEPFEVINSSSSQQKTLKKTILDFILSFTSTSFYQDDMFLGEEPNFKGIKGIVLDPLPVFDNFPQLLPVHEVAFYVYDDNQNHKYSDTCKIKFLKGLKEAPPVLMDKIINLLKQLSTLYDSTHENIDKFNFCSLKKDLGLHQSIKYLSQQLQFKKRIRELYPLQNPTFNPFILSAFIDWNIFSKQELKNIHLNILKNNLNKFDKLFFCNEVLSIFSQEQLETAPWLKENIEIYLKVIEKIHLKSYQFTEEPCYRLLSIPFISSSLSFSMKAKIFQSQMKKIKTDDLLTKYHPKFYARRIPSIFQASFEDLRFRSSQFWISDFSIKFQNSEGKIETGCGRGVNKDWYSQITRGMVNLDLGLFSKTRKNYYFFNRQSWVNPRHLQFFEFIGKVFALSFVKQDCYEICPSFSLILYKMILNQPIEITDLKQEFDQAEVIENLEKLKTFTDDSMFWQNFVFEDVKLISDNHIHNLKEEPDEKSQHYLLKEAVTIEDYHQDKETPQKIAKAYKVGSAIQLVPGGADIPVTLNNVQEYIKLSKQKILELVVGSISQQAKAFLEGFRKVVDIRYLEKFTPNELRTIAEGSGRVTVEDLKQDVILSNYTPTDLPIQLLWSVLEELTPEDLEYFIQHWTGSPKIPAGGLKQLKLTISKNKNDKRVYAQTCFMKINLPEFSRKEEMEEGVMTAINSVKIELSYLED